MSIFKSALKILLRSKLILAVYTVFTVFFIYKAIDFYTPDIIHYEGNLLQFSVYAFAIFAFLGFEYCVKCKKSNMDECLKAMKNGFFKWSTAELKCMLIPISAFAGVALCIHLIVFFTGETAFFSYLPRLLADLLLNYFLLPLTGVWRKKGCAPISAEYEKQKTGAFNGSCFFVCVLIYCFGTNFSVPPIYG